jgi:3-oxoacyl-[acyl-carrier protein] reductase
MIPIDCSEKNALVCGSTQGIGKAIAIRLAEAGANITLAARNEKTLRELRDELPVVSPEQVHNFMLADFSSLESVKNAIDVQLQKGMRFQILVNNTGGPSPGTIVDASTNDFLAALSQHLLCSHTLVQACLKGMKEEKYGRIINIISTSVKQPIPNLGVSNTTRGAVSSWAKTLSLELASFGITVNNILPGYIQTGRLDSLINSTSALQNVSLEQVQETMLKSVPAGRFGSPDELANLAVFLASPLAHYINGTSIAVDGGRTTAF